VSMAEEIRQLRFVAPPGACRVLLLRHGETTPVRDGLTIPLLEGQSNPDLDPVGVDEARRAAERLADEEIAAIYVTPLVRTHQTAAPLAERLGVEPVVEPRLIEIHLGDWEGGEYRRRVAARDPIAVRIMDEQRWDVVPGAERMDRFAARVREGIGAAARAHPDQTVVIVSHGGTIGQALAQASGSRPLAFAPDNGSISELVVSGDNWVLRRFNDVAHLARP
jgi:2,3-bisphosphoglycerate-dependent phosphoglycerate mutase